MIVAALLAVAPLRASGAQADGGGRAAAPAPVATPPASDAPPATGPAGGPSMPLLPSPTTQAGLLGPEGGLSTQPSLIVQRFKFTGNRHVPDADLAGVVKGYLDRPLTIEDLEQARVDLTAYLVGKGYINSGAVLPDQTVADGTVTFDVVEGRLTEVRVTGNKVLRGRYIVSRLQRAGRTPLDIIKVKDQLELLRQDPNIRSINAELRPGAAPGQSVLDVRVDENLALGAVPLSLAFQYSNRRPPSVGSTAFDVLVTDTDLTGNGDTLFIRYDLANGRLQDPQLAGSDDYSIDYTLPITAADTTLNFNFTRTDSVVVETPFEDLNIDSRSNSYALTVRQPIFRRPTFEPGIAATATSPAVRARPATDIALFGAFAFREDQTTLLGRPFEFSPGSDSGKSKVWAARFGQELTARTQADALSLRSTISVGLPIFDATTNDHRFPDGRFVAWLGQAQYVRRLGPTFQFGRLDLSDTQLVLKGAAQYSNRALLPTEQFAVGGFESVRGYRENFLVRDRGAVGSVELRIPVIQARGGDNVLTVVPFVDVGVASDWPRFDPNGRSRASNLGTTDISSVGVGLIFAPDPHVTAQLFYGYALQNRSDTRQDLQDVGIHFNLRVLAF